MIYFTGKSGTIGQHISDDLVPISINLASEYKDFQSLNFKSNDSVLHLAGIVGNQKVGKDIQFAKKVNVDGTIKLAKTAIAKNVSKFVFISSSHVYAPTDDDISESHQISSKSHYSAQKIDAENLLFKEFEDFPEKLLVVRLFSILDLNTSEESLGGAIRRIKTGQSESLISNPDHIRDFLTPRQAAKALELMTRNPNMHGLVNLCTGEGTTIKEATLRLMELNNSDYHDRLFESSKGAASRMVGSNNKLIKLDPNLQLRWEYLSSGDMPFSKKSLVRD